MAKHSEQTSTETRVSYKLNASKLRLNRFQLTVAYDGGDETSYSFDDAPVVIGKSHEDVHLTLMDEIVSRRHCEIVREGDFYVLQDSDSTNGTFVNGLRIKQIYLEPKVTFQVGDAYITFDHAHEEVRIVPTQDRQLGKVIGGDVKMREIFSIIKKIAPTDTTVIIEGETGTGKDVVAQTIHDTSARAKHPFVVVDCSAIPEHLIESELFGHEKGSFTGAIMARKGLFEQADGGTIFLDELGELSLDLQPKLLRVLESRRIRRVGGTQSTSVNVRVIAATNRELESEVRAGRFREDLFYRLSVVRIFLPPLRDRISDIPLLVSHFLSHATFNRDERSSIKVDHIQAEALKRMLAHRWSGNVRELVNVIERACMFADARTITVKDLPPQVQKAQGDQVALSQPLDDQQSLSVVDLSLMGGATTLSSNTATLRSEELPQSPASSSQTQAQSSSSNVTGEDDFENFKSAKERWITLFESDYILTALKRSNYNISQASREADIDRKYFRKLMQKYSIDIP